MQTQPPRRWPPTAIVVTVVLALFLTVTGIASVFVAISLGRLRAANEDLEEQIDDSRARISDLEDQLAAAEDSGDPLADAFGEGGLGDLLGGLLGGGQGEEGQGGELGDLGALEDLLGGLLGGLQGDPSGDPGDARRSVRWYDRWPRHGVVGSMPDH